jgi:hypothetical protein
MRQEAAGDRYERDTFSSISDTTFVSALPMVTIDPVPKRLITTALGSAAQLSTRNPAFYAIASIDSITNLNCAQPILFVFETDL